MGKFNTYFSMKKFEKIIIEMFYKYCYYRGTLVLKSLKDNIQKYFHPVFKYFVMCVFIKINLKQT